jgi:transposase
MFNLSATVKIFVCTKPVDMRRSFDGLFSLVEELIRQDPFSGSLFLFRGRRGDFIKILWWDLDGWAIFAKRLEIGSFRFPEVKFVNGEYQTVEIERGDLLLLLEGIDVRSAKKSHRYRRQNRDQHPATPPKLPTRPGRVRKRPVHGPAPII